MTGDIIPPARPQQDRTATADILLTSRGINFGLLGVRGYYRDTMGVPGVNDYGIYDDAVFFSTPWTFATFNANTDPSKQYPNVAVLAPGLWQYKLGIHGITKPPSRRYEALVQAGPVRVNRYKGKQGHTGWFGINIHRGGRTTTSSAGCQTIHPDQWDRFMNLIRIDMKRSGRATLPYLLTER